MQWIICEPSTAPLECQAQHAGGRSPGRHAPGPLSDSPPYPCGHNGGTGLVGLSCKGLGSVDRNNKTTLPLTPPPRSIKSYAKDLSPRMVKLQDVSSPS